MGGSKNNFFKVFLMRNKMNVIDWVYFWFYGWDNGSLEREGNVLKFI